MGINICGEVSNRLLPEVLIRVAEEWSQPAAVAWGVNPDRRAVLVFWFAARIQTTDKHAQLAELIKYNLIVMPAGFQSAAADDAGHR